MPSESTRSVHIHVPILLDGTSIQSLQMPISPVGSRLGLVMVRVWSRVRDMVRDRSTLNCGKGWGRVSSYDQA